MVENLGIHMQKRKEKQKVKEKSGTIFKILLKIFLRPKCKFINFLEENLCDLRLGKNFLDMTPFFKKIVVSGDGTQGLVHAR
jgi:hypothetical protein